MPCPRGFVGRLDHKHTLCSGALIPDRASSVQQSSEALHMLAPSVEGGVNAVQETSVFCVCGVRRARHGHPLEGRASCTPGIITQHASSSLHEVGEVVMLYEQQSGTCISFFSRLLYYLRFKSLTGIRFAPETMTSLDMMRGFGCDDVDLFCASWTFRFLCVLRCSNQWRGGSSFFYGAGI